MSHTEARDIREKAKIVKRRLLRPQRRQDDFLNKRKKPIIVERGKRRRLIEKGSNFQKAGRSLAGNESQKQNQMVMFISTSE